MELVLEGALILGRAEGSLAPLETVAGELARLIGAPVTPAWFTPP
jgi:hypothetical protein